MSSILYYISGHGYGHAVRSNQVIRALRRARPDLQIHVRSTAPNWLFHDPVFPVSQTSRSIDVGIIQPNSLEMDLQATLQACQALHDTLPEIIAQEIAFIRHEKIGLVVGDIPPACFEIAARAKIPSVAITNFTWDVIYSAYVDRHRDFLSLIAEMRGFYEKTSLALTLPYPCDMSMFPRRQAIPWVTRVSRLTKEQARREFNLPQSATIVLLSFGGMGLDSLPWDILKGLKDFFFVATGSVEVSRGNLLVLSDAQRHYEDLLRGVDVIVTKPGYGIVADVISHHVPILYTDRGEFPEYPRLVEALQDCASAEYIPQGELLAGNIESYLQRLLSKANWPAIELDGAEVAAASILNVLESHAHRRESTERRKSSIGYPREIESWLTASGDSSRLKLDPMTVEQVILAKPRGFCAGVEMAVETVERALQRYGAPIYVFHEIVHNLYVVREFTNRGVHFVQSMDEVPAGAKLIFSAHGISPVVWQQAREKRLELIIDATCPLVEKVHREVRKYAALGYWVILVGHEKHDEIVGTSGEAPDRIRVVANVDEARRAEIPNPDRVVALTQTTLSVDDTRDVIEVLKKRFPNLVTPAKEDICYATQNRQDAVKQLSEEADLVLVIGSRNSENSNQLRKVAWAQGKPAYLIDDYHAIDPRWLIGVKRVGITSGASAPERLVQEAAEYFKQMGAEVNQVGFVEENIHFALPSETAGVP